MRLRILILSLYILPLATFAQAGKSPNSLSEKDRTFVFIQRRQTSGGESGLEKAYKTGRNRFCFANAAVVDEGKRRGRAGLQDTMRSRIVGNLYMG